MSTSKRNSEPTKPTGRFDLVISTDVLEHIPEEHIDDIIADIFSYSDRWVQLPVSPSAEQFSRVIFVMIDMILKLTETQNGEREVKLNSIIVHETDTGYAQCFESDAYSENMGIIDPEKIIFSDAIKADWSDKELWEKIKRGDKFINPTSV